MNNLLGNALKYAHKEVQVSMQESDNHCLIHIDDDGPGIPQDKRTDIFSPFTRLDESRTRDSGGHGLGLTITQRIIKAHGGEVLVSDSLIHSKQTGARFTLSMPKSHSSE